MRLNQSVMLEHIGHCIDSIRQSLMCSSDISVIVWQWRNETQLVHPHGGIVHTCRNFEKISEWAKENKAAVNVDCEKYISDDIVIPEF
jgi:hypothetical protein